MKKVIIQRQKWRDYIKYLIVNEYGSVQLELFGNEQDFGGTAFIYGLWVEPTARLKGNARKLLFLAENIAIEAGHKDIFMEFEKKDTPIAVLKWYMRLGYYEVTSDENGCLLKKVIQNKEEKK